MTNPYHRPGLLATRAGVPDPILLVDLWLAQAGGGTTPVPAIVGRCAHHAEGLDLRRAEEPAEHATISVVVY